MKIAISFILAAAWALASCSDGYSVDFGNIDFPVKSTQDQAFKDSLLKKDANWSKSQMNDTVIIHTNQKSYHLGEEVILTIQNKSSETEYFYEDPKESESYFDAFPDLSSYKIDRFKEGLVSEDPAMTGFLSYVDPYIVHLNLAGVNTVLASKTGVKGFEDPLEPGESMTFHVKMPSRAGLYRFRVKRHAHGTSGLWAYGLNQELVSNIFEIVEE